MPHTLNVEMRERGFSPYDKTLQEVVEFYERSEICKSVTFVCNRTKRDNQLSHGKLEPGEFQTDSDKSSEKGSIWNTFKSKTSIVTMFCPLHNTEQWT